MRTLALWLTHGRQDLTNQMLAQFSTQDTIPYVVVDNGSYVPIEVPPGAPFIRIPENKHFVGGWNYALKCLDPSAGWTHVWMLNDDVQGFNLELLQNVAAGFRTGYKFAAITPSFNSPHQVFHNFKTNVVRMSTWVDWCCPIVSLDAWSDVGPFDERFTGYGADLDWCKRARDRGWLFGVDDRYEINHLGSQTSTVDGSHNKMRCVDSMNRVLREKWGVYDWSQMI